jgi:xanthine dehydrogenase YagS FAD-binding subunit
MKPLSWTNAQTIAEVVTQLSADVVVKAGGVDLMDLLKEQLIAPQRLVNLRTVRGLDGITDARDGVRLGALVTLARLAEHPVVRQKHLALADAAAHAATPQIRNMATVGGNLLQRPRCWYFRAAEMRCRKKGGALCLAHDGENAYHSIFDNQRCAAPHPSSTATALVAFGARLSIASPGAPSREVPLDGFFTTPEVDVMTENALRQDELVTEILLPKPAPQTTSAYGKLGEKESFDWPLAEVCVVLERDRDGKTCKRASIVLGAVAPAPHRARAAEIALAGRAVDEDSASRAARAALEGATPLAHNGYKLAIVEALVRRTILAARSAP